MACLSKLGLSSATAKSAGVWNVVSSLLSTPPADEDEGSQLQEELVSFCASNWRSCLHSCSDAGVLCVVLGAVLGGAGGPCASPRLFNPAQALAAVLHKCTRLRATSDEAAWHLASCVAPMLLTSIGSSGGGGGGSADRSSHQSCRVGSNSSSSTPPPAIAAAQTALNTLAAVAEDAALSGEVRSAADGVLLWQRQALVLAAMLRPGISSTDGVSSPASPLHPHSNGSGSPARGPSAAIVAVGALITGALQLMPPATAPSTPASASNRGSNHTDGSGNGGGDRTPPPRLIGPTVPSGCLAAPGSPLASIAAECCNSRLATPASRRSAVALAVAAAETSPEAFAGAAPLLTLAAAHDGAAGVRRLALGGLIDAFIGHAAVSSAHDSGGGSSGDGGGGGGDSSGGGGGGCNDAGAAPAAPQAPRLPASVWANTCSLLQRCMRGDGCNAGSGGSSGGGAAGLGDAWEVRAAVVGAARLLLEAWGACEEQGHAEVLLLELARMRVLAQQAQREGQHGQQHRFQQQQQQPGQRRAAAAAVAAADLAERFVAEFPARAPSPARRGAAQAATLLLVDALDRGVLQLRPPQPQPHLLSPPTSAAAAGTALVPAPGAEGEAGGAKAQAWQLVHLAAAAAAAASPVVGAEDTTIIGNGAGGSGGVDVVLAEVSRAVAEGAFFDDVVTGGGGGGGGGSGGGGLQPCHVEAWLRF